MRGGGADGGGGAGEGWRGGDGAGAAAVCGGAGVLVRASGAGGGGGLAACAAGCCTNLMDFCDAGGSGGQDPLVRPADVSGARRRDGRVGQVTIERGPLPAPMQYAGSFLRASMLGWKDKVAVARGLSGLMRGMRSATTRAWCSGTGGRGRRSGRFAFLGADRACDAERQLGELLDALCGQGVLRDLSEELRMGGRLGIPTVPLSEFYAAGAD